MHAYRMQKIAAVFLNQIAIKHSPKKLRNSPSGIAFSLGKMISVGKEIIFTVFLKNSFIEAGMIFSKQIPNLAK